MSFGSKPKTQVVPVTPTVATPAVEAAADAERRRQRTASGRAATMLTTPGSAGQASPLVGTTKLLGG